MKTPGQMPSGLGREGPNIRFRGGTIFNDAATGIIWVGGYISLGSDETLVGKKQF